MKDVEGIEICRLTDKDVVRHPMVMRIIRAYETDAKKSRRTPKKEKNEG